MKVFVYGTLKNGNRLHGALSSSEYMGAAITKHPAYDMYHGGGFPYVLNGEHRIKGEVYEISPETLAKLDRIEGVPNLYERIITEVSILDIDAEDSVYMYVASPQTESYLLPVIKEKRGPNQAAVRYNIKHNFKEWDPGRAAY